MRKPLRAAFVVTLSALAMGSEARSDAPPIHRNPPPRPRLYPDGGPTGPSLLPAADPAAQPEPGYTKPVGAPDVPGAGASAVGARPPKHANPPPRARPAPEARGEPDAGPPAPRVKLSNLPPPPPLVLIHRNPPPREMINANPPPTQPDPRMMELPDAGPPPTPVRTSGPPRRPHEPAGPMVQPVPAGTPDLPRTEAKPSVAP